MRISHSGSWPVEEAMGGHQGLLSRDHASEPPFFLLLSAELPLHTDGTAVLPLGLLPA